MVSINANSATEGSFSAEGRSAHECGVRGLGYVRLEPGEIEQLRRTLGMGTSRPLPNTFLKHADEQTVAGLAAMYAALENAIATESDLAAADFSDWAIVGAPRFAGRMCCTAARTRFAQRGPNAVSLHLIPQSSLHSLSGAASVAFSIRGPNLGAGGGPGAFSEGLLTVATLVDIHKLPGVWLVATEWDPEPMPDDDGGCTNAAVCHALAMALSPGDSARRLCLRWEGAGSSATANVAGEKSLALQNEHTSLASLAGRLGLIEGRGLHEYPAAVPVFEHLYSWGLRVSLVAGKLSSHESLAHA